MLDDRPVTASAMDFAVAIMLGRTPRTLRMDLTECKNCDGLEKMSLNYDLFSESFAVSCACGNHAVIARSVRSAVSNWNRKNGN